MKKLFIPLIVLVFLTVTSCSEKTNIEEEKEAIKKVITESTEAYRVKNYERLAATWIHDLSAIKLTARKGSYNTHYGWSEISTRYKSDFERFQN